MGREVRRAEKTFEWPLKKTWWGYILEPVACQTCGGRGKNSKGDYCPTCGGERQAMPTIEPSAWPVKEFDASYRSHEMWADQYGWQMWETTSEGSPISPVCDSPEDLARWLADNNASSFGGRTATYEQWLAMINQGWAPSWVFSPTEGLKSGVEALEDL